MSKSSFDVAESILGLKYQVVREEKVRGGKESEFWRVMGPQYHSIEDAERDRNALRDEIASSIQSWMDRCTKAQKEQNRAKAERDEAVNEISNLSMIASNMEATNQRLRERLAEIEADKPASRPDFAIDFGKEPFCMVADFVCDRQIEHYNKVGWDEYEKQVASVFRSLLQQDGTLQIKASGAANSLAYRMWHAPLLREECLAAREIHPNGEMHTGICASDNLGQTCGTASCKLAKARNAVDEAGALKP